MKQSLCKILAKDRHEASWAQKLPEPESCRGIVRVSETMNISPGDYIVIAGKRARVQRRGELAKSGAMSMQVKMLMMLR